MAELRDQIRAWADTAEAHASAAGATPVTAEEAQQRAGRLVSRPGRPRRRAWVAAASVLVAMLIAGLLVVRSGDGGDTGDERATDGSADGASAAEVGFRVLGRSEVSSERLGTLRSASNPGGVEALWAGAGLEAPAPSVDLAVEAVVSITIGDDLCPPTLDRFVRVGDELTPVFVEPSAPCEEPEVARTFVVAVAWATTGPSFLLSLPADEVGATPRRVLEVGQPTSTPRGGPVLWPDAATRLDRSSAEAAARSFVIHVLGAVEVDATADRGAGTGGPTPVEVDLGSTRTTVLTAPTADGWIVLQAGDAQLGVSQDPPRVQVPAVPASETVEVLARTDWAATATVHEAVDVVGGVDLHLGIVRSIVVVHRDGSGAVLALDGGRV